MLKVSFKDDFKKVQTFNEKATVVNLTGTVKFPNELFRLIPLDLDEWIFHHPAVEVVDSVVRGWTLKVSGTSKCSEGDVFDAVIGERLAEARAKLKIYRFMYTLCSKLLHYYFGMMYGNAEIDRVTESHSEPPKDCIWMTYKKYKSLMIKESHHLGQLLSET
jgi:hypothetical protein